MAGSGTEIRITNVNKTVKQELTNIADNIGVDLAPFLKMKLKDIRDSYPEEMRKPKRKF